MAEDFEGAKLDNISLTIDGREVEVQKGLTVLEAAREAGIYIPALCHHPDLPPKE
jgi:NADH dehydrogenase/NADH:ubiquinone oxidoreductase subunit G